MNSKCKALAYEKSGGVVSQRLIWEEGFSACVQAGVVEEDVLLVAHHMRQPESLRMLASSLAKHGDAKRRDWLESLQGEVDESVFGFGKWVLSIEVLMQCLAKDGRTVPWGRLLGFVSCCAEYVATRPDAGELADAVRDMYRSYGLIEN